MPNVPSRSVIDTELTTRQLFNGPISMHIRIVSILFVLAVAATAVGCASTSRARYDSAEEAFNRGQALYERGKYDSAILAFQAALQFGRAGEWADDAQLALARAYVANKEYILAASEFSRFSEIYRNDPRREQAEYERALAYYELSPPFELDQTDTERAIKQFNNFIERFPTSTLVPEATAKINELRGKMAHKDFETAKLYERRELWEAAALVYDNVFDQYPETEWADDALVGAMNAYINFAEASIPERQEPRLQKAVEDYRRLVQVFPDSPLRSQAEDLNRRATNRIQHLTSLAEQN